MRTRTDERTVVEWSPSELQRIATSDDLHISPFREDGETYGTPTWIWSVVARPSIRLHSRSDAPHPCNSPQRDPV
jgi:hypothetical protein